MVLPAKTEHQKVADFTLQRLFPMVDEFILAHKLKTSMEAGLIILLSQRLAYQGFKKEVLMEMVGSSYDILALPQAPPTPKAKPKPAEPTPARTADIVHLRPPSR